MTELIRGDEIRAIKRVKGKVWWCPWCDTSHQDSQPNCTKCGAVRYEAAPVAVLRAVAASVPSLAPEPPPTIPTVETKAPVSRPDRDKAKKPKHGGRR